MKQFIYLLASAFMNVNASAQQNALTPQTTIDGLVATSGLGNIRLNWKSNEAGESAYWEVQGSADGKSFKTIGYVMGADPKAPKGSYAYKQDTAKLQPGMKFFRVLHIESTSTALASNVIGLSK